MRWQRPSMMLTKTPPWMTPTHGVWQTHQSATTRDEDDMGKTQDDDTTAKPEPATTPTPPPPTDTPQTEPPEATTK